MAAGWSAEQDEAMVGVWRELFAETDRELTQVQELVLDLNGDCVLPGNAECAVLNDKIHGLEAELTRLKFSNDE
eukprot:SAG22_NODE_13047_length_420_cov_1.610592_1_plen_73_part_10